jgi:uncharacterized membrane protein HdeD (DUF308 family)
MDDTLTRNWGWVVFRGVVAVVFGLLTFMAPVTTLAVLILFFGAYALLDGICAVVAAIVNRRSEPRWVALLIGGIVGIIIGVCTFMVPGITATFLLYLIAFWAMVVGFSEIATAVRLRKVITGEWMLGLAGVLSVLLGLFLVSRPALGAIAVVLWIGAYACVTGILLVALGFKLRRWARGQESSMPREA